METCNVFGTRVTVGGAELPAADNNNWYLMCEGTTPAEFLQWIRQEEDRLRREIQADPRLLSSPQHRRTREIRQAMKQCCLWHYYGVR